MVIELPDEEEKSMDTEQEKIQVELDKVGIGYLPKRFRSEQGVENALVDKLNSDAVK